MTSVTIPDSVTSIEFYAFSGCSGLTSVIFNGNAPDIVSDTFSDVHSGCTAYVKRDSTGWGVDIPGMWNGLNIRYLDDRESHVVTFNANGGTSAETARTVDDGAAVGDLPEATWSGYAFAGWFTAADGGNRVTEETVVTGDVTYYAHWTALASVEQTIAIPRAGWNLVSFNVVPDDPSPGAVFAEVADSVQSVVSGTRRWTPQSGGRLAEMAPGVGYWLKAAKAGTIVFDK